MAKPAHNRISFEGELPNGEIFSFGLSDSSGLSPQAAATAAQGPAQTWFVSPPSYTNANAVLTHVVAEAVNAAGAVTASYAQATQRVNGSSTLSLVGLLCHAVTLETATLDNHGRTVRGRCYPPAYATVNGALANQSDITDIAHSFAAFITALNTAGLAICVASSTVGGQLAPVTATSADNIIDTQRRRKNHVTGVRSAKQPV